MLAMLLALVVAAPAAEAANDGVRSVTVAVVHQTGGTGREPRA